MTRRLLQSLFLLALALALPVALPARAGVDPQLADAIDRIKAIDNHAHPLRVVRENEKPDDEYDALIFEEMEPFPLFVRFRLDNTEYISAWRTLYGYRYDDMTPPHVQELLATKRRVMREQGDGYPAWVLDRLGIETMLANRVAMGAGLTPPRFRWVSFVDALMLPLDNTTAKAANPDRRAFYTGEERLLKRYLADSKVPALPDTLSNYLTRVVTATLERQKRDGAVAAKFELAYLRTLEVGQVSEDEASPVYARYVHGGRPPVTDYKRLQDFLFRYIARECGRLGLVVHIHVHAGAGSYFNLRTTNPLLLEGVFTDPSLRKTTFVLVHGGWPFTKETAALLFKPNVYADFSAQTFVQYPRSLSEVLRSWLEFFPEKVLFGTDVEPLTPEVNWEETGWLSTTTARKALALALSGMMADGEITRERALELARMVLRENAAKLYGFDRQK